MQCIATLSSSTYISGADEKVRLILSVAIVVLYIYLQVMRVFSAPRNFIDSLERISGVSLTQVLHMHTEDQPTGLAQIVLIVCSG